MKKYNDKWAANLDERNFSFLIKIVAIEIYTGLNYR